MADPAVAAIKGGATMSRPEPITRCPVCGGYRHKATVCHTCRVLVGGGR